MTTFRLIPGDCLAGLATLPDASVHCCVTSPPYWGLRDYGVDGQLGLEPTPGEYVAKMVAVFREVRRVLRDDGTLWLNLGDSYANDTKWGGSSGGKHVADLHGDSGIGRGKRNTGLKAKDLVGIPWRVAFALQADGWYLRSDIIWSKPNPMPESVTDRPTKAHEYLFLLSKSERYHYDADAIKERGSTATGNVTDLDSLAGRNYDHRADGLTVGKGEAHTSGTRSGGNLSKAYAGVDWTVVGRNRRTVWTIPTEPFPGAHFAVMPTALVKPCILAGCPTGGTVLDPFTGSGTVAVVALENGCAFVGCELNPAYVDIAKKRVGNVTPATLLRGAS